VAQLEKYLHSLSFQVDPGRHQWLIGIKFGQTPYLLEILARRGGFVDKWAEVIVKQKLRAQSETDIEELQT